MTSNQIRQSFLEFFAEKGHKVVPSAPMVLKNDPTLMFTNAGMNQFKDIFLGNRVPGHPRVADTQKCLRVTGKHNDLEEVGHDTFHHTMFEMLGNWSFGDYFKKEAISWAWEFLTGRMGLDPGRIYVTIFRGDPDDGVERDREAYECWREFLEEDRILDGSKKDNFWEMGDTGPCGPCSEIHVDLRDDEERARIPGISLVNAGHPEVIEIWNLVFIQFNRKADGVLENLPEKHVDTGMGFERLCMAMQGKRSSYDTDLFQPLIRKISAFCDIPYGTGSADDPEAGGEGADDPEAGGAGSADDPEAGEEGADDPEARTAGADKDADPDQGGAPAKGFPSAQTDVAMRVVADHLRAIAFSIADGQLPSNNKAGYVIRRILRRAVRYGFTYLDRKEPCIHLLVPPLVEAMGDTFPELKSQQELIIRVIREEEQSFLITLETGMRLLDQLIEKARKEKYRVIPGRDAFVLYDTYGFPLDLTELILAEQGMKVDRGEFELEMEAQKSRSKQAAESESGDWTVLVQDHVEEFVGYDRLSAEVNITRFRKVVSRKKELYHLVFNITPFYAESGGQTGDRGYIENDRERVEIIDTKKENELIIHVTKKLPEDPASPFMAKVNAGRRVNTANNHTATHLLHHALREVLGGHIEQKGSLVDPEYLRFDFSHFQKLTEEELREIEHRVNRMIRQNFTAEESRAVPMAEAREMGAIALFGEKYGDLVRVMRFGDSVELCGGTHVQATGQIGSFRILRESSIAAGIRRIEAVTGEAADKYIDEQVDTLREVSDLFEKQKDTVRAVRDLLSENSRLQKEVEKFRKEAQGSIVEELEKSAEEIGDIRFIAYRFEAQDASQLREIAFRMRDRVKNLCLVLGTEIEGKAHLAIMISNDLVESRSLNASEMIRAIAPEIQGGGGGQPFFATAGGKNPAGIEKALQKAGELIRKI